ncbi:MAG: S6e family ribosomal protein [Thermoplasmata archaeon]
MAKAVAVIGDPQSKKSFKREIVPESLSALYGRKIGDEVDGIFFGLPGYRMKITGGSTIDGFPMKKDLPIAGKKMILVTYSKGERAKKGVRKRITYRGSIIGSDTSQINLKVTQYGPAPLEEEQKENQ